MQALFTQVETTATAAAAMPIGLLLWPQLFGTDCSYKIEVQQEQHKQYNTATMTAGM